MLEPVVEIEQQVTFNQEQLQTLFTLLQKRGCQLVGPTIRDGAIAYDELNSTADLPVGWTDDQDAGHYRLVRRQDAAYFGYVVGPHSWKKFLYPPVLSLWKANRHKGEMVIASETSVTPKYALIGVRSCELHAIAILDKIFLQGEYTDPVYKARREKAFIVAVNCVTTGGTCFCVSMRTGPKATSGFDLALTEVIDGQRHYFVAESGSRQGAEVLAEITKQQATSEEQDAAKDLLEKAAKKMGRQLDTTGIYELLYRNVECARWDDVASRCLTCTNCTMVCPTCFCMTVVDTTDFTGQHAERTRHWDSCFTLDFSYIHGGNIRTSPKSRYRQWMTHKLAAWQDQFGTSGCVGCGRCITWCPAGIDITEEARAIRAGDKRDKATMAIKEP
jgi:formate hydrogenlyase subunit 6/NADH:ubiquinone oxidoreductase subunit I